VITQGRPSSTCRLPPPDAATANAPGELAPPADIAPRFDPLRLSSSSAASASLRRRAVSTVSAASITSVRTRPCPRSYTRVRA